MVTIALPISLIHSSFEISNLSSIWPPRKHFSVYLIRILNGPACGCCCLSCHWALLQKAWICHLSAPLPFGVWNQQQDLLFALVSHSWTHPGVSVCPHKHMMQLHSSWWLSTVPVNAFLVLCTPKETPQIQPQKCWTEGNKCFPDKWLHCCYSNLHNLSQVQDPRPHLPLNFMTFCQIILQSAQILWTTAAPSSVTLPTNLLRVHSIPPPRSWIKILNSVMPTMNPWGRPLVQPVISSASCCWLQLFQHGGPADFLPQLSSTYRIHTPLIWL